VNVSQWLQSLEAFTGEFYKRRPFVEFRGILSYLMRRLRDGYVMELGMLRTMLKVAGGYSFADYSPAASLNDTQLEGRAGSVALKRETMSFGIVETTSDVATNRMRQILQNDGLGVSMLILIAQARDRILFDSTKEAMKEVKLVGNLFDACQVVMSILLEFLTDDSRSGNADKDTTGTMNDPIALYSKSLPSLKELQVVSGLDLSTSWFLCRPAFKAILNQSDDDVDMDGDAEKVEIRADTSISSDSSTLLVPDSVLSFLSPALIEAFYMNDLYCVFCPLVLYGLETTRIGKEIERIQTKKASGVSGANGTKSEPDNVDRLSSVASDLSHDLERQQKYVELTFSRLDKKKEEFFPIGEVSQEAAKNFVIHCIYPRSVQSPDGAMYSSEFAFRLHKIWTPGFSIIHYIDELILIVAGALYGVTEGEAANLGILLWQTWKVVNRWRYVDGLFEKEVFGKPSGCVESNGDDEGDTTSKAVSQKDFVLLYNKWHSSLGAAVVGCLESSEYMHTRTALVVLTRLVDVFPTRPAMGNKLLAVLEPLQDESSSRPDIRASASAYGMMLMKARDDGKWVEEDKAVAQARADKERAVAEERKRNLEKTFQELERDSVKISAEIGPRDGFRDRNEQRRREYNNPRGTVQLDPDGGGRDSTARGTPDQFNDRGTEYSRMESGEVIARDRRDERDRRHSRDPDRPSNKDDDRGRGKVDGDDDRRRDIGGDGPKDRGLRWQPPQRGSKRSSPSSPGPGDDREDDRSNAKRQRLDPESYPLRRSAGRGDSPPRRPSSPEPPSRPRARRGTTSRR
jgi:THO complex subunit 2